MQLIKLDAIDSTNDFLKALVNTQYVENFTVVTAENQTKGKGQMGAKWVSETGKNLTMSLLIKDVLSDISQIYNLNVAVALSIITALESYNIPKLSIKWPNDIMADTKKIGGILIENSIKSGGEIFSIVGIGLNVNQIHFENLPKASSLAVVMKTDFDKNELLDKIVTALKRNIAKLLNNKSESLWQHYRNSIFRKGVPMPFATEDQNPFMAIIQDVSDDGKLVLILEDDSVLSYEIKEIQMLY